MRCNIVVTMNTIVPSPPTNAFSQLLTSSSSTPMFLTVRVQQPSSASESKVSTRSTRVNFRNLIFLFLLFNSLLTGSRAREPVIYPNGTIIRRKASCIGLVIPYRMPPFCSISCMGKFKLSRNRIPTLLASFPRPPSLTILFANSVPRIVP